MESTIRDLGGNEMEKQKVAAYSVAGAGILAAIGAFFAGDTTLAELFNAVLQAVGLDTVQVPVE